MLQTDHRRGSRTPRLLWLGLAATLALGGAPAVAQDAASPPAASEGGTGTVYAMTNGLAGNEIVAYERAADGSLSAAGRFDTEGLGSGSFENSDTALVVASAEGQSSPVDLGGGDDLVLAVNAGSDSVSVFGVTDDGLELVETEPTGGERPTSLTVHGGLVYVLNSAGNGGGAGLCFGGAPSVTGFTIEGDGAMAPIANSTVELSGGADSGCAQVSFTPDGSMLVVSQITANTVTIFPVEEDGTLGEAVENEPVGNGPFGFTFDGEGRLLLTQNSQAAPGLGTVASYAIGDDGVMAAIGETVDTGETDPCWFVVTPDGRFGFVTNFGPSGLLAIDAEAGRRGTISSFRLGEDGALELMEAQAAQVGVGAADLAIGGEGRFLYALNSVEGSITGYAIGDEGELGLVAAVGGLPTNPVGPLPIAMGLAARDNG